MNQISQFFIKNSKLTIILSLFVVVFGLNALKNLNSESFPNVDIGTALINTDYNGASAADIETKITKPIEDEIRSVDGIKDVRSISQAGKSKIVVRLDIDKVNIRTSMADLQRAVDRVNKLPVDLIDRPSFVEINSEEFPVLEIAIIGTNENRERDLIADLLKEEFEDNKHVLNIRLTGHSKREFLISLDRQKMAHHHIGLNEVISKIQSRNVNIPGGLLKGKDQKILRLEGKIRDKREIENILLRSAFSGPRVIVKDVAQVFDGPSELEKRIRYQDQPATLLTVTKKGGADTLAMVKDLKQTLEAFKTKYGKDFRFVIYNDEGVKVKNRLEVLSSNAITGLILVIIFLLIFLPGKIGLMASLSLPLAVMGTMGFMPLYDMNLNAITILALVIALGMMVDNSVVISENFARLVKDGFPPVDAAKKSIKSLWLPISVTAFTTIAAFLPMLVTKGVMGQFIRFIPILVTISLLMSLGESFFLLPMRLVKSVSKKLKDKIQSDSSSDWFQLALLPKFESLMKTLLKHRYITFFVYTGVLTAALLLMTVGNKLILFPADQTEIYVARLTMPSGTTLERTDEAIATIAKEINAKFGKHITHLVSRSGIQNLGPGDPKDKSGDYVGMMNIYVTTDARDNLPSTEALKILRQIKFDGAELSFEALVNGPPVGEPVFATLRSNNLENLNHVAKTIKSKLAETTGLFDVQIDDVVGDDEIFVDINYDLVDRLELNVNTIGQTIRSAISGTIVSDVTLDNKKVDIKVKFSPVHRNEIEDLEKIKVMNRSGDLIALSKFAKFHREPGAPQIKRFDFKRSKTITANISEDKITAIQANAILLDEFNRLKEEFSDVSIVFSGEAESTKESMQSLWDALVLSLIGIFGLLVFLFSSYLRPLIIMSTIPLGLVGFSVAFALHGRPISFLALIGVIGLGGIIVNAGIVLISFIEELKEENPDWTLDETLVTASKLRLRAVVVSSLTTISGLLPTAYGIGGSDALLIPMTLAMAWGLTSGTILTIMWVPCAYRILEDLNIWLKSLGAKPQSRSNPPLVESNRISSGEIL